MFDFAPTYDGSGLRQSKSLACLPLYDFDDIEDIDEPRVSRKRRELSIMDQSSPISPVFTISPTSSEHSLTPTTPTSQLKSIWRDSRGSLVQSPVPRLQRAPFGNHEKRRVSLQCISAPSTVTSVTNSSVSRRTDHDGDITMLSPPASAHRSDIWDQTTTSPILGQLMGLPLRPAQIAFEPAETSTNEPQQPSNADHQRPRTRPSHMTHRRSRTLSRPRTLTERQSRSHDRRTSTSTSTSTTSSSSSNSNNNQRHQPRSQTQPPPKLRLPSPSPQQTRTTNQLSKSIQHLGIPLVPLISVTTGLPHPDFPRSILQYHLLTHAQLDSLARWYHQTTDNTSERFMYPAVIERPWVLTNNVASESESVGESEELAAKRRRFGRFIGLRGCESPVVERGEGVETLAEKMEREWRAALRRAEEEERTLEKVWRGRF